MNALKLISLIILLLLSSMAILAERNDTVDKQTATTSTQTSVQEKPDSEKELGEIIAPYVKKVQNVLVKIKISGVKDPSTYLDISLILLLLTIIFMFIEQHFKTSMIPTYCFALATYICELLYLAHDPDPLWFLIYPKFFKKLLWTIISSATLYAQILCTIRLINTAAYRAGSMMTANIGLKGTGIAIALMLICGLFFREWIKPLFYIYAVFFIGNFFAFILTSQLKNPIQLIFTLLLFTFGGLTCAIYFVKIVLFALIMAIILYIAFIAITHIGDSSDDTEYYVKDEFGNKKKVDKHYDLTGDSYYRDKDGNEYWK